MSPSTLFLSWQHPAPDNRRWFVVGRLSGAGPADDGQYSFTYTQGARDAVAAGFSPLASFPSFDERYDADHLFATFRNRLASSAQPGYSDVLEWLGVSDEEATPLTLLDRTNGARETDSLELFRLPERASDGTLCATFFVRGLRHRDTDIQARAAALVSGDRLSLSRNYGNPSDDSALLVHTPQGIHGFGWLPRYLARGIRHLLDAAPGSVDVTVDAVNAPPAPAQFRLRCRLVARDVPAGFSLLDAREFQPLVP